MALIANALGGALRKEMKARVDELLKAQQDTNKRIDKLVAILEDFQNNPDMVALMKASEKWLEAARTTQQASQSVEVTLVRITQELGKL